MLASAAALAAVKAASSICTQHANTSIWLAQLYAGRWQTKVATKGVKRDASHPAHLHSIRLLGWRCLRASKGELSRAGCLRSLLSKGEASFDLGRCASSKASSPSLLPKAKAAGRLSSCAKRLAAARRLLRATKHAG